MIVAMLLNGLVQGAAIVGISYCVMRWVPERNASTRYALWFVALLALAIVPVLTATSNLGARLFDAFRPPPGEHGIIISLLPVGTLEHNATQLAAPATAWIVAIWLMGMIIQGLRLTASFVRIERIRQNADRLDICGERVFLSDEVAIPIAAGLFDPVVILPRTIAETLEPKDLERVVAHERAHIRRKDVASNFMQRLIETILFFNPWVYVVGGNIIKEREAACDDVAVQSTGTASDYAQCLACLANGVQQRKAPLLSPSALGSNKSVVSRIERLIRNGESAVTSLNYYSIGGTIVLFAILTLAFQTLSSASPIPVHAPQASPPGSNSVASACSVPNADAKVVTAVAPEIPHSAGPLQGYVNILVTIAPNGAVSKAAVEHTSGNGQVDAAVLKAAKSSTYSPARQNCVPATGSYLFHAEFAPQQ